MNQIYLNDNGEIVINQIPFEDFNVDPKFTGPPDFIVTREELDKLSK